MSLKFKLFGYDCTLSRACKGGLVRDNTLVDKDISACNDTFARVQNVIHRQIGNSISEVVMSSTSDSLGFDSLDEIELLLYLEEEFCIPIDDVEFERCKTVGDIVCLIDAKLAKFKKMDNYSHNIRMAIQD